MYQSFGQNATDAEALLKKRCMIFAKDQERIEKAIQPLHSQLQRNEKGERHCRAISNFEILRLCFQFSI